MFPLGDLDKERVRRHAERLELRVWDKVESQDLCFVPDGDYAGFITGTLGERRGTEPGWFVDLEGRHLGTHRGILHYTVGQRRGLGVSSTEPLFVVAIDSATRTVTLGNRRALESPGLVTQPMNWLIAEPPEPGAAVEVQIRYHHVPARARVFPREDGRAEVRFEEPQAAVTPGQSCVLYDGDRVLGGAPIDHAVPRPGGTRPSLPDTRLAVPS
jgi:tRNA-specific 2-thiouridylase